MRSLWEYVTEHRAVAAAYVAGCIALFVVLALLTGGPTAGMSYSCADVANSSEVTSTVDTAFQEKHSDSPFALFITADEICSKYGKPDDNAIALMEDLLSNPDSFDSGPGYEMQGLPAYPMN